MEVPRQDRAAPSHSSRRISRTTAADPAPISVREELWPERISEAASRAMSSVISMSLVTLPETVRAFVSPVALSVRTQYPGHA